MSTLEIEGYRADAQLAEGQGWRLLKARRQLQDAPVLLLVMAASEPQARVLLRAHAGLRQSGIATVLDIGETREGGLYAALTDVPGPSLAAALRQGMDLDQSCQLLRRLAATLAYLLQKGAPAPELEPDAVLLDAQSRPVITRLKGPSTTSAQPRLIERLGRYFHEALTGIDPDPQAWPPALPDYLTRWQSIIDGCLGPDRFESVQALLVELDRLEGRVATVAPPQAPSTPPAPADAARQPQPQPGSEQGPPDGTAPAADAATAVSLRRPAADAVEQAASASPAPTQSHSRPNAASDSAEPLPAHLRATGPSKAVALERAVEPRPSPKPGGRSQSPAPEPKGRRMLAAGLIALALGLPALAGLAWWLLTDQENGPRAGTAPAAAPEPIATPPAAPVTRPTTFLDLIQAAEPDSVEVMAIDPAELATVEDPLPRFILMARTNLEAGRLVDPPTRNALERFLQALSIDPGNREAQAGLAETARRCLQGAEQDAVPALLQRFACAERVAAAHSAAVGAREEVARLRMAAIEQRLGPARAALADWQSARALALFEEVLALDPQQADARAGADEARRQGRPGYTFRDALRGGGQGPELRIAAGLAWGRYEITVADYSRYWQAAGQARFGGNLPSCRDRESLLRSSRRRSWQQPELPQTEQHPVVCVSAAMADHYVEWLSAETGQAYRLPRRGEWEALAGQAPSDCSANFRDAAAAAAWNAREALPCNDGHAQTAAVGSLPAGPGGLNELWGNAAEWLQDCAAPNCRERLAAGGSWFSARGETGIRGFAAEAAFTTIGLRVVRELPSPEARD